MLSTGTPQGGANANDDEARRLNTHQLKLHLENRIRIAKNTIGSNEGELRDIERDIALEDAAYRRVLEEAHRMAEDIRRLVESSKSGSVMTEEAVRGIRESEQAIAHEHDDLKKLEKELEELRETVKEKENAIVELKHKNAKMLKAREEFRKRSDVEGASTKADEEHLHKKKVDFQLVESDARRKEDALAHKHERREEIKRDMRLREQEVVDLEVELRRLNARV